MKNAYPLTLFLFFTGASLFAQPMLQTNVLPGIGDVATIQIADTNSVAEGNAGANQTWDFSGLVPEAGTPPTDYIYMAPSSTPPQYAAEFPDANLALQINFDTTVYGYADLSAAEFAFLGIKNDQVEQIYTDPEVQLKPLAFGQSFTDDFTKETDAGLGQILYGYGTRTVTYDGYGTLITPLGTYNNAMRINSTATQVDSSSFSGSTILTETEITTYDWFIPNGPGLLVSISYTSTVTTTSFPGFPPFVVESGPTKSASYLTEISTSTFDLPSKLTGMELSISGANPVHDQLLVRIQSQEEVSGLQLFITDNQGRQVDRRAIDIRRGENGVNLPVGHLPGGIYQLSLTDGKAVNTIKWQKL